jgi:hypothetical protein
MIGLGSLTAPLVRAYCAPRAAAFARALDDVQSAQTRTLGSIASAAAETDYGRSLGIRSGQAVEAFRACVPVVEYSDLEPWIEQQRRTNRSILTPGETHCYEQTSGSSGAIKYIPCNDALLRSFRSLFAIWAHDLLKECLRVRSGRTFISISPRFSTRDDFADDSAYLGWPLRTLIGRFLVAPRGLERLRNAEEFRDALSCALLACEDLEIISIWNPSYLLVLLEHMQARCERLLHKLTRKRAAALEHAPWFWPDVWPRLQLISCWTGAAAAAPAGKLAEMFPRTRVQGKGLLSTEAPLTVPLAVAAGPLPLVDEVFFELEDDDRNLFLLHEVEADKAYQVIITQAGGLLRYRLGDRVRVNGWYRGCPTLEFVGRSDAVSDLVGEKLNEGFVAQILREIAAPGAFCTLLPVMPREERAGYCLLTDDANPGIGELLEAQLARAVRYREARLLGQLGGVTVISRADMRRRVHDAMVAGGMKMGDIKDRALITRQEFAGRVYKNVASDQRVSR